jgi:hypothetical protein
VDRLARAERSRQIFDPHSLAAAGLAVVAALLFQPRLGPRAAILAGAMAFAWATGRKVPLLGTAFMILGIVGANLLVPVGRVLAVWGPVRVTETALLEGIERAVTFEALIYVSKAAIRSDLRIPGRAGTLIGSALRCYERILETRIKLRRATFLRDLDEILLGIYDGELSSPPERPSAKTSGRGGAGATFLVLAAAAAWLPYLVRAIR